VPLLETIVYTFQFEIGVDERPPDVHPAQKVHSVLPVKQLQILTQDQKLKDTFSIRFPGSPKVPTHLNMRILKTQKFLLRFRVKKLVLKNFNAV
jgi:hypothetical protein